MRACPNTAFTGFADRYNLTGDWYWVEVYHERGAPFNDAIKAGAWKFYPNATGFVKITWPTSWPNVTIVAKAKSYDGTEIGAGELYRGIIVYMLVVNASPSYLNAKFGLTVTERRNGTVLLDGTRVFTPLFGQSWATLLGLSTSACIQGSSATMLRAVCARSLLFSGNIRMRPRSWLGARASYR
jgi:hypothetical protein